MRGLPKGSIKETTRPRRATSRLSHAPQFGKFGPSNDELSCRTLRRASHELRPTASRTGRGPRRTGQPAATAPAALGAAVEPAVGFRPGGLRPAGLRPTGVRATGLRPQGYGQQGYGQQPPAYPPPGAPGGYGQAPAQTSPLAIVSLVLGIVGFLCCGLFVFSIGALVTGFLARKQIGESQGRLKGAGMATAGLILGAVAIVRGHHLLGADRGRRVRQQHVRRHLLIGPAAGRPGPAQGASQLPAGRLRSTAKATITTAASAIHTRGVPARPVGRWRPRPRPLRPAHPPERQHREHHDEEQVAAERADHVAVGEVVHGSQRATARAGVTGEHEPGAEPPAAGGVRVPEVQRQHQPSGERTRQQRAAQPVEPRRLGDRELRRRRSPQCLVSPSLP